MAMELIKSEVTVVGGGIAGICAAIAAARHGLKVSLSATHGSPSSCLLLLLLMESK